MSREHRHPLVGFVVAAVLATAGLVVAAGDADASPVWPSCEVRGSRLVLDTGDVVRGRVASVRTDRVQWQRRAGGSWSAELDLQRGLVHVVIKSRAPKFSDRRWSGWIDCEATS